MKRSDLHFFVDAVAFAMFVFLVATGVLMEYLLPAGSGYSTRLWGLDRHAWGDIHFWIAVAFLTALAVHVYLHWKWIVSVLRGHPREGSGVRVGLGVVGLVSLLAIAVAPLLSPVERSEGSRIAADPRWGLSAEAEALQGSTTLDEVVRTTGVTLHYLVSELGLPANVSPDDHLGLLARENGFSVADVRDVVERGRTVGDIRRSGDAVLPTASESPSDNVESDMPKTAVREERQAAGETHVEEHNSRPLGSAEIRGSTTLRAIVAWGVPRETLFRELGLPTRIPMSETLGRLGRAYGFTLIDVRELVDVHR